jgi:hypothetical protein
MTRVNPVKYTRLGRIEFSSQSLLVFRGNDHTVLKLTIPLSVKLPRVTEKVQC